MKELKIVCTIDLLVKHQKIAALAEVRMNVASSKLLSAWGPCEEHLAVSTQSKIREETDRRILLDTKGPETRTHDMENGAIEFHTTRCSYFNDLEVLGTKENSLSLIQN